MKPEQREWWGAYERSAGMSQAYRQGHQPAASGIMYPTFLLGASADSQKNFRQYRKR